MEFWMVGIECLNSFFSHSYHSHNRTTRTHPRTQLQVTRTGLNLYSDFYSSDVLVASPLGLRRIIGSEGERERDFDFLSSIEVFVLDQVLGVVVGVWVWVWL